MSNSRLRKTSSLRGRELLPINDDDDEDGCHGHSILRRHSSLPPKRKNVHFADGFGKPLVSVFSEEEYNIHVAIAAAKRELQNAKKSLKVCFEQPVASEGFRERIEKQFVCLENAVTSQNSLMGTIKVMNIAFHKEVFVRYTLDSWNSHTDVMCSYVQDSNDGITDRFSFAITIPEYFIASGDSFEFAVCYKSDGNEYWDNNGGINYRVECTSAVHNNESHLNGF
ncbi:protein phosphatase 1 regulatory subunit 3B-like [Actinia tenebrosa]|uniref:Protein phosphatase 1 regulatory subunit 3B-like n=1 Tax=Actinia tenebrosa TaxID=6105 RepID=A0A6P8HY40_ACTTE|nr:protein phosphatase 1 regulatory subunit 3B-like [Actinia tenebrosa]